MRRVVLVVVMGAVLSLLGACAKDGGERQAQQGNAASNEGIVGAIKEKTLADYPTSTIGNAFDTYRYFDKREWKETRSSDGKIYVDFWGWFNTATLDAASVKNGIVARGVAAKFVVYRDGAFNLAMISKIETRADGKMYVYPLADKKSIMDAIYANKEISF